MENSEQTSVKISILRGGSSRAVFVSSDDFPPPAATAERDALARALLGVGDAHQIDGLGGGEPRSSKLAIVGPSARNDADVDYTFAQICSEPPEVQWSMNCGNISAAVGPYAIDTGLVDAAAPVTCVRIHNTNTGSIILATVPVHGGLAAVAGQALVDGIAGTGAPIALDFTDSAGAVTGAILPTGRPRDRISAEGLGMIDVSVVDVGNPVVFVRASDVGCAGTERPAT
ncbi:MAG: PrpF domain-containing protein, partial [bacterium]